MKPNLSPFTDWFRDEFAVTAIEYALLASLIAIAIVVGVGATGVSLNVMFTTVTNAVSAAVAGAL